MSASWIARLVLAACMTLSCVAVLELGVRLVGRADEDGNFAVGRREVRPRHLPVARLQAAVRQYRESPHVLFTEDSRLGWKPRPHAHNDLYAYDSGGLRSRTADDAAVPAQPAALRIAIFGDSFAHGSEVGFDESWGARLQQALDRPDRPVQVLNFGVPGYGMDQAFLRWEQEGRAHAPAVVIFGLQVENAARNLNLLRVLYDSADLPFAKPRFVEAGDGLQLVNVPVPAPEEVVRIVGDLDRWPLVRYERYYDEGDYRPRFWHRSRLAGMLETLLAGRSRIQPGDELPEEQRRLALRIIGAFARSVEEAGARFVMVHFPRRVDLERARGAGELPNVGLLNAANAIAPVVRVDRVLLDRAGTGDLAPLFSPGGHYSPDGYAVLAAALADELRPALAARRTSGRGTTKAWTH